MQAVTHYNNYDILAEVSRNLGEAMVGINVSILPQEELMASEAGKSNYELRIIELRIT